VLYWQLAQLGVHCDVIALIARPGLLKNFVLFPLARLGSARAHALEGNRERSRADYDVFLELWKTADADGPLLQQARAESARLR
jgi:hypothetical protein